MDHPFFTLVGLIVNLLQLKSQGNGSGNGGQAATGNDTSPFSTHPAIMFIGILCLFLYVWTHLASSIAGITRMAAGAGSTTSSSSSLSRLFAKVSCSAKPLMVVFGSMAVAALGYPLFPNSALRHVLCPLYVLIWCGAVLRSLWLQSRTGNVTQSSSSLQNRRTRSRRTRSSRRRNLLPLSNRDPQVQQNPRV